MSSSVLRRASERTVSEPNPLAHLPRVASLRVVLVAEEPQRLPPFLPTAVHGAIGRPLKTLGCDERPRCETCAGLPGCRYALLYAPKEQTASGTTDAPPPLVVAAETPAWHEQPSLLQPGETISFRVSLIGDAAIAQERLVVRALEAVAGSGLGIVAESEGAVIAPRPALALRSIDRIERMTFRSGAASSFDVVFDSPLRLVVDGSVVETLDARSLYRGLVRRIVGLGKLYGTGDIRVPESPSFSIESQSMRAVQTTRYSDRQKQRMEWRGILGRVRVSGASPLDAALFEYASRVQIGKASAFGFGSFHLE